MAIKIGEEDGRFRSDLPRNRWRKCPDFSFYPYLSQFCMFLNMLIFRTGLAVSKNKLKKVCLTFGK
jgi:hypothetical protein